MAGSDVASPEQIAAAHKLELARGAGQRYLVQKWEDGSICDKTNQPRKIEVQVTDSLFPQLSFLYRPGPKIHGFADHCCFCYLLDVRSDRLVGFPNIQSMNH